MNHLRSKIIRDPLIWKFCAYGFLKNLKLFEPYLMIYLLGMGQDLFQIGLLYSIREIITYIFEIPSGVLADYYGKKRELMTCFIFYIISFLFFFAGSNFIILAGAMFFFGLGEAFRSGTHKAMIYSYLERKEWFNEKTFVYGRTRSFSLAGSSISAFLSIIFVLNIPSLKWIFIVCTIPYFLDFILIWSYPDFLDERKITDFRFKGFFQLVIGHIRSILHRPLLKRILLSSSIFDSIFKTIKDYIQPILMLLILSTLDLGNNVQENREILKVSLGIIYGVFYIFSALASRNAHHLHKIGTSSQLMNISLSIAGGIFLLLSFGIYNDMTIFVILLYFVLYVMKDGRRPIFVDVCGNWMKKEERATVMSLDSQLRAVITVFAAPIAGFVAENFSIPVLFLALGIIVLCAGRIVIIKEPS